MKKIQIEAGEEFIVELGDKGQRIMTVTIREWGKHFSTNFSPIDEPSVPITEELVKSLGFEYKGEITWTGNGADFQPDSYPRTWQRDYMKNGFLIRFEDFQWEQGGEVKCDESILLFYMLQPWYEKTTEGSLNLEAKFLHELRKIYELYTKKNL